MSDAARDLYRSIKKLCDETDASDAEIIGCLEFVKYEILKTAWVKD